MGYLELGFQESRSLIMIEMLYFYDLVMLVVVFLVMISLVQLGLVIWNSNFTNKILEDNYLEFMWTLLPLFILLFISLPSLFILYLIDSNPGCDLTLKVLGNQWYWNYEYSDILGSKSFDSYMHNGSVFRLVDVDNRVVLPMKVAVRLLVSSTDVLHSFALPSVGVKIDAIPGRLNQGFIYLCSPGLYYGQCSEICGVNHSFMPIMIESVNVKSFIEWLGMLD
uniref:cytochrome c oxidase subunit II n=1 Tax=Sacculina confragosa TaxID=238040 RepID=UPI002551D375|nr:cytochrome c oxidase subunit II [Sacculina confragosa]WGU20858.1 cytochrome c oxidase subunit II [Sacculina confragosa]